MSFQFQAPNFDFIATAGKQAADTLTNYNTAKQIEIDDDQAKQAYEQIISQVKDKWKAATGKDDDVAATAFAAKYVMPKMKSETGSQAATRWLAIEPVLDKALTEIETRQYKSKAADVGKQISGGYGPEVYKAIQSGQLSAAEISKKYGVTLDEPTYQKIAGIAPPQPIAGLTPKAQASFDQPMSQDQAIRDTSIAQPMPYSKAVQTVQGAGLPKEQAETLQPLISTAANRSTAEAYNRMQKPTEAGFLTGKLGQGEPIDEGAKAMAGAIRAEETLKGKSDYSKMRKFEQQVSLLKVYMQDWKNRKDFERDYGKDATKAIENMNALIQKKLDTEAEIEAARNWTDMDKPAPDVITLHEKIRNYENQIDQLRSKIPDIERMADRIGTPPTQLIPPQVTEPGARSDQYPTPTKKPKAGAGLPRFSSPNDAAFKKLAPGSKFIDGNGVTRTKK
jgi:hypothetical protein